MAALLPPALARNRAGTLHGADVNGCRHHAFVSCEDWNLPPGGDLDWLDDAPRQDGGVGLRGLLHQFRPDRDTAPQAEPTTGGGGVFDRYGNLYSLADDHRGVRIRSTGSGTMSDFWPVPASPAARRPTSAGSFAAVTPTTSAPVPTRLDALTVTSGHYLVAAASGETGGLVILDLHGAGVAVFQPWPGLGPVEALVALEDGGIGALIDSRLWCTGPDLRPCLTAAAPAATFRPATAPTTASRPPALAAPASPHHLDLRPALHPVAGTTVRVTAVAALPGARLLVSGRRGTEPVLGVMRRDGTVLNVAGEPLDALIATVVEPDPDTPDADRRPALAERAFAVDLGASPGDNPDAPFSIHVVAAGGDQAFRFEARWRDDGTTLAISVTRDYLPMRRYGGGGLAALPAGVQLAGQAHARVFHASNGRWVPLLAVPQPRHPVAAVLTLPVRDSGLPGCVWHRVALDLRLPPGTTVTLESRASDDAARLANDADTPWQSEPGPQRQPAGSEQPWRDTTDPAASTWGTLLQAAYGRWLQLRLTLRGDGRRTPRVRALRVVFPRFSYAQDYLPPVYRADPAGADLLDRFLALFEREFTRWEERIAAVQWLLDARTAPAEALPWLAGWLGLALDPARDDPTRQRLLLRHAMLRNARRGTVPGLLLGATLAWERDLTEIDPRWLDDPGQLAERRGGVRLQELAGLAPPLPAGAWQPGRRSRAALLDSLAGDARLHPDDGETAHRARLAAAFGFLPRAAAEEARLWQDWQTARGTPPAPPPTDEPVTVAARTAWRDYLQASAPCAPLRQRWQDFLARRWRRISALNAAWGTAWTGFDRIGSPLHLPVGEAALADWHRFEARVLRALGSAHRFRIVLPLPDGPLDLDDLARRRDAVLRAVEADKPAHTVAEVRFGFDLFRVGAARLGQDTRIEHGLARRPELAVLGRADLDGVRLAPARPIPPADRVGPGLRFPASVSSASTGRS